MKNYLATLLACFLFTSLSANFVSGQLVSTAKSETPPLSETLAWLSDRLVSDATFSPPDKYGRPLTLMFGFSPIRFQSCELEWKHWIGSSLSGQSGYTVKTISLAKLDTAKAVAESMTADGSVVGVSLGTADGAKSIKSQYFRSGSVSPSVSFTATAEIYVKDVESSARITKAFQHAILLCQNQKEPF